MDQCATRSSIYYYPVLWNIEHMRPLTFSPNNKKCVDWALHVLEKKYQCLVLSADYGTEIVYVNKCHLR